MAIDYQALHRMITSEEFQTLVELGREEFDKVLLANIKNGGIQTIDSEHYLLNYERFVTIFKRPVTDGLST